MPISAFFFDLDETLLDGSGAPATIRLTCEQIALARPGLDATRLFEANDAIWQDYWPEVEERWMRGRMATSDVGLEAWRRALRACGCDDESVARLATETLARLARASLRLFDDVEAILSVVEGRLPLAVITNGASDLQREKLQVTGIESRFGAVVISGEVGVIKPDAAVFDIALDKLGVSREGAWHVGDNLRSDVGGAKAAGLTAVWLNRHGAVRKPEDPEPDFEVQSLTELAALVATRL